MNIIKKTVFSIIMLGILSHPVRANEPKSSWFSTIYSSTKNAFDYVVNKIKTPALYINVFGAGIFSAPYLAKTMSALLSSQQAKTAGIQVKNIFDTTTTQKIATYAGLGIGAVATPYLATWLLVRQAHAKFDDAITLIKTPDIKNYADTLDSLHKSVSNTLQNLLDEPDSILKNKAKFNESFNYILNLNNKLVNILNNLMNEIRTSNVPTDQILQDIKNNAIALTSLNTEFSDTIHQLKTKNYTTTSSLVEDLLTLSKINRNRQALINTIVLINIPSLESYKNNDLTNKIATIIRSKYNISSKTQTATPLTRYRDDLTWYINRLWYLQILYLGTDKRSEIQELIANLKKIRKILAGSKELKKEQENILSRQNQK